LELSKKGKNYRRSLITDYLKNVADYEGALDYESYSQKHPLSHREDYQSKIKAILTERKRAGAGYGSTASSLYSKGLTAGGYAERIQSEVNPNAEKQLSAAHREYARQEEGLIRGYLNYLDDYRQSQSKMLSEVTERLINSGFMNQEDAYDFARRAGLNDSRAQTASKRATEAVRQELMRRVIAEVSDLKLRGESAIVYSMRQGLSKSDAEVVKNFAERLYDSELEMTDELRDYIESLENFGDRFSEGELD